MKHIKQKEERKFQWKIKKENNSIIDIEFINNFDDIILEIPFFVNNLLDKDKIDTDIYVQAPDNKIDLSINYNLLMDYIEDDVLTLWAPKYYVWDDDHEYNESFWDGISDYWDDFEDKEIIEIIWRNYKEKILEQEGILDQLNQSKSILSIPYGIEKRWKRFEWDENLNLKTEIEGYLTDIPYFLTEDYEIFDIEHRVSEGKIFFDSLDEGPLTLWAPRYYIHNNLIIDRIASLINFDEPGFNINKRSIMFSNMVKGLWYTLVNGPTLENIEISLYILFGAPITFDQEEILEVDNNKIVTSHNTWEFSPEVLTPWNFKEDRYLQEGDEIDRLSRLVKGLEIKDYISHPDWWEDRLTHEVQKHTYIELPLDDEVFPSVLRNETIDIFMDRIFPQHCYFDMFIETNPTPPDTSGFFLTTHVRGDGKIEIHPNRDIYHDGEPVTLKAIGDDFRGWIGHKGIDREIEVIMDKHKFIEGVFEEVGEYELTTNIVGGDGEITIKPNKDTYNFGNRIEAYIDPKGEYEFENWGGVATNTRNPLFFSIEEDTTLTAFLSHPDKEGYHLKTKVIGDGSLEIDPKKERYNEGEMVKIKAVDGDDTFNRWVYRDEKDREIRLKMNTNKHIEALFGQREDIRLITEVRGEGEIEVKPDKVKYGYQEEIEIKAIPSDGKSFDVWGGSYFDDKLISKNPKTITLTETVSVVANFVDHPTKREEVTDVRTIEDGHFEDGEILITIDGEHTFLDAELDHDIKRIAQGYLEYINDVIPKNFFEAIEVEQSQLDKLKELSEEAGHNNPKFYLDVSNSLNEPDYNIDNNFEVASFIFYHLSFLGHLKDIVYLEEKRENQNMYEELEIDGMEKHKIF